MILRRLVLGRSEATATAVMLIALVASLYFLAHPTAPAHADVTTTVVPTDVDAVPLLACATGGVTPSGQVVVRLSGLNSTGTPVGSVAAPVGLQIGLVNSGQLTFSAPPAGNPPTYVALMGTTVNVWLSGTLTPATPQSVLLLQDGATVAETVPLPTNLATCTAIPATLAPADFGLGAAPAAPVIASFPTTCNADGSASLSLTLTTASAPLPPLYTQSSGLTEVDEGVFIADQAGVLLVPGGSTLVRFDPASVAGTAVALPAISIPARPAGTSYQAYVTGPDGQISTPLAIPACTPVPGPTTAAPVVVPSTSASTPTVPSSSAAPSDPHTTDAATSADSSTSASGPTSAATTAIAPPVATAVSPDVALPTEASMQDSSPESSPPPSASAVSSPTPLIDVPSSGFGPGDAPDTSSGSPTSAALPGHDPSASPTVVISGTGAQISVHDKDAAGSESTIRPVQILRWHQDAALVVGFDALAICSLVGATVWSARRR